MDYDLARKTRRTGNFGLALVVLLLFWVSLFPMGCITSGSTPAPKNQLVTMYDMYNFQFNDYVEMVTNGQELTEEQRQILIKKKEILSKAYPLIKLYDSLISTGGDIPATLVTDIFALLNSLLL